MVDFIDKTEGADGTPLNRENLMAIQGFDFEDVEIEENNGVTTITQVNGSGQTLTVEIKENEDGSMTITETFVGEKTITKTTNINAEGTQVRGEVK